MSLLPRNDTRNFFYLIMIDVIFWPLNDRHNFFYRLMIDVIFLLLNDRHNFFYVLSFQDNKDTVLCI